MNLEQETTNQSEELSHAAKAGAEVGTWTIDDLHLHGLMVGRTKQEAAKVCLGNVEAYVEMNLARQVSESKKAYFNAMLQAARESLGAIMKNGEVQA